MSSQIATDCDTRRPVLLSAAAGLLMLAGTACDAAATTGALPDAGGTGPPPVVEWDAHDYAYTAPERLPAGWVTIRMTNRGQEPHHGQLLRLDEGVTFERLSAALEREGESAVRRTVPRR